MMPAFAVALVCLAALHPGVLAIAPSIESTKDGIVMSVPASTAVVVNKYDGAGEIVSSAPLVTQDDLDAAVQTAQADLQASHQTLQDQLDAKEERLKALEAKILDLASIDDVNSKADGTDVTKLKDDVAAVAAKTDGLRKELDEAELDLVELTEQGEAKSTCLSNVVAQIGDGAIDKCPKPGVPIPQCPELAVLQHGTSKGTARSVGALRLFSCAAGFTMTGATTTVCGKDLKWTNKVPACMATVTCTMNTDDRTLGVWIDGKRIGTTPLQGTQYIIHTWNNMEQFSFSSDAKVLGIKYVNGQTCIHGGMMLTCTTNAGDTPWTDAKSEPGSKKWKIFAHTDITALGGDDWAKPAFDASKWGKARPGFTSKTSDYQPARCFLLDKPGYVVACNGRRQFNSDKNGNPTGPFYTQYPCQGGSAGKCQQAKSPKIAQSICADEEDSTNVVAPYNDVDEHTSHYYWHRFTPGV